MRKPKQKDMHETYDDIFDEIKSLYVTERKDNIYDLAGMCQKLLKCVEGEGEKYDEVYGLVRKYVIRMFKKVLKTKNYKTRGKALELLLELERDLPF